MVYTYYIQCSIYITNGAGLNVDGFVLWFVDVPHVCPGLGGFEWGMLTIGPGDGQLFLPVRNVGIRPRLCCGPTPLPLFFLFRLQTQGQVIVNNHSIRVLY